MSRNITIKASQKYAKNPSLLIKELEASLGKTLNPEQLMAFNHDTGPLCIVAGPGSGKTEILCWRVLKLLLVELIKPSEIFLTTFTEKAAANLVDRIAEMIKSLENFNHEHYGINIRSLRAGTLHSLCHQILKDFHSPNFENLELMDGLGQLFFVLKYCHFMNKPGRSPISGASKEFWDYFTSGRNKMKFERLKQGIMILDRVVEDNLNQDLMAASTIPPVQELVKIYNCYQKALMNQKRCDFAYLQKYFLDFLTSPEGRVFLGDGEKSPGIQYVLVDEYQDTNPIQEEIYFQLARKTHNLTVVGDDDQSLYRFRGASVETFINFHERCIKDWGAEPIKVQLTLNYRSHPSIVKFFNEYVCNHEAFTNRLVSSKMLYSRAPNKKPMKASKLDDVKSIPITVIRGKDTKDYTKKIGNYIHDLISSKKLGDLSDVAILCQSTKNSPRNAGPLLAQLEALNIPYYNPRARDIQNTEEVKNLLGAVISIIDAQQSVQEDEDFGKFTTASSFVGECRDSFNQLISHRGYNELEKYISEMVALIKGSEPRASLNITLTDCYNKLLTLPPFSSYTGDPTIGPRVAALTDVIAKFANIYWNQFIHSSEKSGLKRNLISSFYTYCLKTIESQGMNDPSEESPEILAHHVQVLTYHQAKGLEFHYVILMDLNKGARVGSEHVIEERLNEFRARQYTFFPAEVRAQHDYIRRIYVGMSRAQKVLILGAFDLSTCGLSLGFDEKGESKCTLDWYMKQGYQTL